MDQDGPLRRRMGGAGRRVSPLLGRLWQRFIALHERWLDLRDRVLARPGFQRWAARFPLTRGVARSRATGLFDLMAGFVYAQVFAAVVELRLPEALAAGPRALDQLAEAAGLPPERLRRLLDAAVSLDVLKRRRGERYGLGPVGTAYLGNTLVVQRMVAHHRLLYRDLADPVALLRGPAAPTELGRFWSYAGPAGEASGREQVAPYSELMASSLPAIAEDVLEACPPPARARWLDVAGGRGAFLEAVAARAPELELVLFDLPPVAELARARLAAVGLGDQVSVQGGDLFRDPLPGPVDRVSLVRVLHDHEDEAVGAILRAVRKALRPGGQLLVVEPMSGTVGAEAMGDAYFGFYLLAMGQGRPRTPETLRRMLLEAGFSRVRLRPTRRPMLARLLVAE